MLELIQEMIHENNQTPADGIPDAKIAGFEAKYDEIVKTAAKEYEYNPLVEPDNNLCERKARILKGKINQAISLRSFEQLTYFCECLSVLDHFATSGEEDLYQAVQDVFNRPKPIKIKTA